MENLIGKPIRTRYIPKMSSEIKRMRRISYLTAVDLIDVRVNREVQPINNSVSLSLAIELDGIR